MLERGEQHLVIARGDLRIVANLGPEPIDAPALVGATIVFESTERAVVSTDQQLQVAGEATVVARLAAS